MKLLFGTINKIDSIHEKDLFKLQPMSSFKYEV